MEDFDSEKLSGVDASVESRALCRNVCYPSIHPNLYPFNDPSVRHLSGLKKKPLKHVDALLPGIGTVAVVDSASFRYISYFRRRPAEAAMQASSQTFHTPTAS
jgi:hypothetical protein